MNYGDTILFAAICLEKCQNGGICTAPNSCTCLKDFTGDRCQHGMSILCISTRIAPGAKDSTNIQVAYICLNNMASVILYPKNYIHSTNLKKQLYFISNHEIRAPKNDLWKY